MTEVLAGGQLPLQERRLVTEIPGPRSRALTARRHGGRRPRRSAACCRSSSSAAGGGVLVDVDGNSLIDLGSGIAVVSVGNARPRWSTAVQEQVAAFTHTCFMVTPYEGYVAVCEAAHPADAGRPRQEGSALFNSGAEAVENAVKIARAATGRARRRGLRPRLPRPHQPHDGADRQEHAVQARLRAVRPARSTGCRCPTRSADRARDCAGRRPPRGRSTQIEKQVGADNVAAIVIEPIQGEGGFIVPAAGLPAGARRLVPRPTASCSSPTRSRPASAAPATGSPASTRASSPT